MLNIYYWNGNTLRIISVYVGCLFIFPCLYKFMVVGVTGRNGAIAQRQSVAYKSGPENV